MALQVDAMRWTTYHGAWLKALGRDSFKEICKAKLFCSESPGDIARQGMKIFGGQGCSLQKNMQRYRRESYLAFRAGGTAEIQKSVIRKSVIARFPLIPGSSIREQASQSQA